MTTVRNIDGGVNRAVERYVAALNGPDHQAAAEHLDDELERLTNAATPTDDLLTYLSDWVDGGGLVIRVSRSPDSWLRKLEELPTLDVRHWSHHTVGSQHEVRETAEDALRRAYAENGKPLQQLSGHVAPFVPTQDDLSLLADIADGYSTVLHYDRLDDLRKRMSEAVK